MKIFFPRLIALFLIFFVLPNAPVGAQNSTEQAPLVFKAETRQVLVDVVVTDHNGHFVPGLKPADFAVLEDGKPQKVVAFGMHAAPSVPPKPAAPIKLPPNQYTNYAIADPERPLTIVLMDVLNTQVQDQAYTRKQMIQFLKELPPGQRVALFALGTRLRTIQGFTGDSDTLVAAAKMLLRDTSPLMTSEANRQEDETVASNLQVNAGPGSVGPPGGTPGGGGRSSNLTTVNTAALAPVASGIQTALAAEQNYQEMQRMDLTLAALASLARAVSAYPGRKNLLWLSAEFPIRFSPDFLPKSRASDEAAGGFQRNTHAQDLRAKAPPVRATAALLTASQVAVYPIDIRGTISTGTGMDISTGNAYGSNARIRDMRDNMATRQTTMQWDDHESMTDIAKETGGQAFYGSNDLKAALSRSMQEGANYYTIAYTPENHKWDGKYRKIEVKCAENGTKLTFRHGYYGVQDTFQNTNAKAEDDQITELFKVSMHPEAPTSTMLLIKVQVLPPDATSKTVRIDYAINAHDVKFTDATENGKHLMLDLMAVAWDKSGKPAAENGGAIDKDIPANIYANVMRSYIPAHQEFEVKPGTYTLRVGVVDRNSRKIGTVDVPLTVPELQASSK